VSVLNPDGTARRRVIAEVEHIPVTPADMDEYLDRRRAAAGPSPVGEGAQFIDEVSALYPAVPMIPFRPIPGRIFPAPSGRFLVERVDLGPEPNEEWEGGTTWDLFDADGRIEGRITTPPSITFLRLTDEGLYTITRDELDVQHLVRYRLVVEGA
jgi:hypothetical protein